MNTIKITRLQACNEQNWIITIVTHFPDPSFIKAHLGFSSRKFDLLYYNRPENQCCTHVHIYQSMHVSCLGMILYVPYVCNNKLVYWSVIKCHQLSFSPICKLAVDTMARTCLLHIYLALYVCLGTYDCTYLALAWLCTCVSCLGMYVRILPWHDFVLTYLGGFKVEFSWILCDLDCNSVR